MRGKQWTRIEELIQELDALPEDQRSDELELLTQKGESKEVISYLRLNYSLRPNPWVVTLGQKIGDKYKLTEKIAAGGMGIVYRAKQDLIGREVAIKMIHPALASAQMFARLKEESALMGRLQHPAIVQIFDADVHKIDHEGKQGALFYTMELIEGPTMRKWMKEEKPGFEQKLEFFAQVCDAVAYAHEKGVLHRDLKPENILVRNGLTPAVLDFGLSRVTDEKRLLGDVAGQPQKKAPEMEMSGTPAYMSPEKWAQTGEDHRGDIYALGVIFYELIWGSRPLEFDTCASFDEMKDIARQWAFKGLEKSQREGIEDRILNVIQRMLSKNPEDRPQSADEVAGVLREVLERRQRIQRLRKAAPWLVAAVLVFLLAIGWAVTVKQYQGRMDASRESLANATQLLRVRSGDAPSKALEMIPASPKNRHSEDSWRQLAVDAMTSWEIVYSGREVKECSRLLAVAEDGVRFFGIDLEGGFVLFENDKSIPLGKAGFEPSLMLRLNLHKLCNMH